MSLDQGNNTPTWRRIEPGSPDPESDALTIRPVRSPVTVFDKIIAVEIKVIIYQDEIKLEIGTYI